MNIVAVSVEPEFITAENTGGGGIDITIESARFQVSEAHNLSTGSLQLHLLPADVEMLTRRLGELLMEAQRQHSVDVDRYADGSPVPDEPYTTRSGTDEHEPTGNYSGEPQKL